MSLSSSTLTALQKVSAAAFAAQKKLQSSVQDYANRVNAAILTDPHGSGNNVLFANWKTVARLAHVMASIEVELTKIYRIGEELSSQGQAEGQTVPVLAAPSPSAKPVARRQKAVVPVSVVVKAKAAAKKETARPVPRAAAETVAAPVVEAVIDLTPTDVVIKSTKKTAKKTTAPKAKIRAAKLDATTDQQPALSGNAATLMQHLAYILNADEFTTMNQTEVGQAIGIKLGSMTAAVKKAVESGHLIVGPAGTFKLGNVGPTTAD